MAASVLGLTNLPTNQVSRRRWIPVIQAHGLFHSAAHGSDRHAPSRGDSAACVRLDLAAARRRTPSLLPRLGVGKADFQDATRSASGGLVFVD
jgi:hypothetical protein